MSNTQSKEVNQEIIEKEKEIIIQKINLDLQLHRRLTYKTLCKICPEATEEKGVVRIKKLPEIVKHHWLLSPERNKYETR